MHEDNVGSIFFYNNKIPFFFFCISAFEYDKHFLSISFHTTRPPNPNSDLNNQKYFKTIFMILFTWRFPSSLVIRTEFHLLVDVVLQCLEVRISRATQIYASIIIINKIPLYSCDNRFE